jgi:hypothetical protein
MTTDPNGAKEETEVGSYFVANYPPFSVWSKEDVERAATPAMQSKPVAGTPLGMYLTSRSVASAVIFVIFAFIPTRTPMKSISTSRR